VHVFAEAQVPVKRQAFVQAKAMSSNKDEKDIEKRADAAAGVHVDYLEVRKPPVEPKKEEPPKPANATAPAAPSKNATAPAPQASNATKPAAAPTPAPAAPSKNATTPAPVQANATAPATPPPPKAAV